MPVGSVRPLPVSRMSSPLDLGDALLLVSAVLRGVPGPGGVSLGDPAVCSDDAFHSQEPEHSKKGGRAGREAFCPC